MKAVVLFAAMCILAPVSPAQQQGASQTWDAWKFLIGKWVGEGTSDVGQGAGYFTFESALNGKALIRKNHAEYPATKDHGPVSHEDLMIVFVDPETKLTRAFYTDSEGNVIHYTVSFSNDGNTLTFLSDVLPKAPRFRLVYVRTKPSEMTITFEIAPPGKPDEFHKFIDAAVRKASESN